MNLITINDLILPTEVALTEEEQERGLMHIKDDVPSVMSFIFAKPGIHYFWMKNTYVPLDIIFCANGKVVSVAQGTPMSDELIGPSIQTEVVIEMPRGSVKRLGIKTGQSVEIQLDSVSLGKRLRAKMPHLG